MNYGSLIPRPVVPPVQPVAPIQPFAQPFIGGPQPSLFNPMA